MYRNIGIIDGDSSRHLVFLAGIYMTCCTQFNIIPAAKWEADEQYMLVSISEPGAPMILKLMLHTKDLSTTMYWDTGT